MLGRRDGSAHDNENESADVDGDGGGSSTARVFGSKVEAWTLGAGGQLWGSRGQRAVFGSIRMRMRLRSTHGPLARHQVADRRARLVGR